ncbi:MAG: cation:proton antiporter [Betaproteobacteria bacterium]|nr:MAG: cation:proton antiporter [Betaproteobacteria bacterium]
MSLLSSLLMLIVAARLLGGLSARLGQPAMVGEILAGVLLGPAVLNIIHPNPSLAGVSELAVFLIILSAGLEIRFSDIFGAMRGRGMLVAVVGFALPFVAGLITGTLFGHDLMRTLFLGLCISITALPVAVKLLSNLGILHSRIAHYALATAVVNDIVALFILGILLNLPQQQTFIDTLATIGTASWKLLALAAVVVALNQLLEWLDRREISVHAVPEALVRYFGPEALFGIVVIFVLVFGSLSEMLGFHFVIGAFFGALFLDQRHFLASRYEELSGTLNSVTTGFLAPVFFAYLGLEFTADAFDDLSFPIVVTLVSVASKVAAGWIGGRLVGMPRQEAIGLGCVLNGRGVMELVVAGIAYQNGFIGQGIFATLVLMGVVTTLLTPLLFRCAYPGKALEAYRQEQASGLSESR